MGSRSIALFILNLGTLDGSEWLTLHPGCFTPGKEPQYPLNVRLDGLQSWYGHFGKKKNLLPPTGIRTPDTPAHSIVTLPITLLGFLMNTKHDTNTPVCL